MTTLPPVPSGVPLGRDIAYPTRYDPSLLFPIARVGARSELGIAPGALPFVGHDRWHAFELSWLDGKGKPQVTTATFTVPADSENLIESKSFKLYLNSLNAHRLENKQALQALVEGDLSRVAAAPVTMTFGVPPLQAHDEAVCIDDADIAITYYGPPNRGLLQLDAPSNVHETLVSHLLKSNCPVTGQPDWASVHIDYHGPRIDHEGLLRYLISFRDHAEFHEQCVERIFIDLQTQCRPHALSVQARYTRRGGLDINPWRASSGLRAPTPYRDPRQ